MRNIVNLLRYVFISTECVVCLVGLAVFLILPQQLTWLSQRIAQQVEILKYLGLLPAGLVAYNATVIKSILLPEADKRNDFQKSPVYTDFRCGCIVGMLYAVVFAISGLACLFFDWGVPTAYQSVFLLTSIVGAGSVSATLFFAHVKIEELFRQHVES